MLIGAKEMKNWGKRDEEVGAALICAKEPSLGQGTILQDVDHCRHTAVMPLTKTAKAASAKMFLQTTWV